MATAHEEMHTEHKEWLSDNSMWRDDLAAWQKEIDQALADLKKLEKALGEHRRTLRKHEKGINVEERFSKIHESSLADFERGGPGNELIRLAKAHKQSTGLHSRQRQAHEGLKRHHHTVMAYWSLLLKSLTDKR